MRFMTRAASLETHGAMIESEWPALVAMAGKAAALVGCKHLSHRPPEASMRIVAIDAVHRVLHDPVTIWLLKRRPDIQVTRRAKLIDAGIGTNHQLVAVIRVNLVAGHAGNILFRVAADQPGCVSVLGAMATKTSLFDRTG